MTYFHTGIRTIIGAKSFHGPVRDGKAWGQLAMVARRNWVSHDCITVIHSNREEARCRTAAPHSIYSVVFLGQIFIIASTT